tara:strand:- start:125 stop:424 length:300 start_codon:yes stop_codon:yes gene_type:complete
MNKYVFVLSAFLLSSVFSYVYAEEKSTDNAKADSNVITIETATIRGNQELPTVLYLVPWQLPEINALEATQTTDMTQHTIELIDRNSFKRLLEYHATLE